MDSQSADNDSRLECGLMVTFFPSNSARNVVCSLAKTPGRTKFRVLARIQFVSLEYSSESVFLQVFTVAFRSYSGAVAARPPRNGAMIVVKKIRQFY